MYLVSESKRVQRGDSGVHLVASRVVGVFGGVEVESREITSLVDLDLELIEGLLQSFDSFFDGSAFSNLLGGCSGFLEGSSAPFEVRLRLGDPRVELGRLANRVANLLFWKTAWDLLSSSILAARR